VQPPLCFQPKSLDNVAGRSGTFGAVSAADDLLMHNADKGQNIITLLGTAITGLNDEPFWHCDDTDFAAQGAYGLRSPYPQSRDKADDMLRKCLAWGKSKLYDGGFEERFSPYYAAPTTGAVAQAKSLLNSDGTVSGFNPGGGVLTSCSFNGQTTGGRAKCNVLEPWGYVLHMAEDFYSHTNWSDFADPSAAISLKNPFGLGNAGTADFLDLRRDLPTGSDIPDRFTGGCFPNKKCSGRIVHGEDPMFWGDLDYGLNKDKGLIDTSNGTTSAPETRRGKITVGGKTDFQRAVDAAVAEARRQWVVFRATLAQRYGTDTAAKMACALSMDDQSVCDKRTIVLAVDTSTPPRSGAARAVAAQADGGDSPAETAGRRLLDSLEPTDEVSVVTFDSSTGDRDADPFTAPAGADIDDAQAGDAEPDPSTVDDGVTPTEPDPTVTPEPDPVVPVDSEGNPQPVADTPDAPQPPSPPLPVPPAAPTAAPAQALNSAAALLGDRQAPEGQQGVILVTNRIGDAGALVRQIRGLGERGAVVSLALYGAQSVPTDVIAAIQATGGTVLSTDRVAQLRRFANLADGAGLTRLDDLMGPGAGAPLDVDQPGLDGVVDGDGATVHDVEALKRGALLTVRAGAPVTVTVLDNASGSTTTADADRDGAAVVRLDKGGDYTVSVSGPAGRRYEAGVS
jgi:hypothetical protein